MLTKDDMDFLIGIVEDDIDPSRSLQISQSYTINVYQVGISVVNDTLNGVISRIMTMNG